MIDLIAPNTRWKEHAACRGQNPDDWQPHRGEWAKIRAAKQTCATCPVLEQCRDYGLWLAQHFDTYGIFGGLTRQERFTYLRNRRIPVRSIGAAGQQTTRRTTAHRTREHGTMAAVKRHQFHGEPLCAECSARLDKYRADIAQARRRKKYGTEGGNK